MYKGTVTFRAVITSNGLKFPSCEFHPNEPGVEKVLIESPSGYEILSTVHLTNVATEEVGRAIATKVIIAALDRISFGYSSAVEKSQITSSHFAPVNPPPGANILIHTGDLVIIGGQRNLIVSLSAAIIKTELERVSPPGERLFGLFRSARRSMGPVEEFMHLYNVLLMLCNKGLPRELQENVDTFILGEEPAAQQSPHPLFSGVKETVYTRLRNEFAHARAGVNLDDTKLEMATHLAGLIPLTKRAIELRH